MSYRDAPRQDLANRRRAVAKSWAVITEALHIHGKTITQRAKRRSQPHERGTNAIAPK